MMNLESNTITREILEHLPAVVFRLARKGDKWEALFVNGNVKRYGYDPEDFMTGKLAYGDIIAPEDKSRMEKMLEDTPDEDVAFLHYRILTKTGERAEVGEYNIVKRDDAGTAKTYDKIIISDRDNIGQPSKLYFDYLTGLPNRFKCLGDLDRAIADAQTAGGEGYLFFIDMDDFKVVNDCYGHDYGDAMLKVFANYLRDVFDVPNRAYRFGGDEFAVILSHEDSGQAEGYLSRLMERAKDKWKVLDREFHCTLSVGAAKFPDGESGHNSVLKHADAALYEAKRMGKNEFAYYKQSLADDDRKIPRMEMLLRRSMENDFEGFQVYYQPVINTETGEMKGAEALLRMIDGDEMILPGEFLTLAEDFGFMDTIGDFVIRTAAAQCRKINDMGFKDFFMTVNFSAKQFGRKDIISHLEKLLKAAGVDFSNIVVSIDDGGADMREERLTQICENLKGMGVKIALDDFGNGKSAILRLKDIPADIIKTSVEFMNNIEDSYSRDLVKIIVEMCHSMGKEAVINGVENKKHYDFCAEVNADCMQGFYMFVPGDAECLESLL